MPHTQNQRIRRLGEENARLRSRNEQLEKALRVADEALATATGIREGDRWRISNARKLIEALSAEPEQGEPNQCDGCRRDLPIVNGIHVDHNGMPVMACTADRYEPAPTPDGGEGVLEAPYEIIGYINQPAYEPGGKVAQGERIIGVRIKMPDWEPERMPSPAPVAWLQECVEGRRALAAAVPEAVRILPNKMRESASSTESSGRKVELLHWAYELDRALAQSEQGRAGWNLVPENPTDRMVELGAVALSRHVDFSDETDPRDSDIVEEIYAEMLAAAPQPQEGKSDG